MTEHDRLRSEAIQALRRAQLSLRKLGTDGTDVEPARAAIREASNVLSRIRRESPGIHDVLSDLDRFEPLKEGHPAIGRICPGCGEVLEAGQRPVFVNSGQTDDPHILTVQLAHEHCAREKA